MVLTRREGASFVLDPTSHRMHLRYKVHLRRSLRSLRRHLRTTRQECHCVGLCRTPHQGGGRTLPATLLVSVSPSQSSPSPSQCSHGAHNSLRTKARNAGVAGPQATRASNTVVNGLPARPHPHLSALAITSPRPSHLPTPLAPWPHRHTTTPVPPTRDQLHADLRSSVTAIRSGERSTTQVAQGRTQDNFP